MKSLLSLPEGRTEMFNGKTLAVIKRELRTHLLSKSFIIMTFLVPVFLFGILGIQTFIMTYENDDESKIIIVSASSEINEALQAELNKQNFYKNNRVTVLFETIGISQVQSFIDKHKTELLDEKLSGIIFLPESAIKDKEISFYSKNPRNNSLFDKIDDHINNVLIDHYFKERKLSDEDISFATHKVEFKEYKVSESDAIKEEGYGNMVLSFLFTFLLYFSLLMFGAAMLTSVLEEKNNRIVEVLLSSLNSTDLLTGKIIGSSITGLIQMGIWLIPVFVLISTTIFALPAEFILSISGSQLLFFLINYFIALITFMGLYAAIGSIFTNTQDAQSGMWPVMLLIMIPFFIAIGMQSNPNNEIARIASMVPFASLIVMPARITIVEVPAWQFIMAIVINLATMLSIFRLAGKIYRVGILSTGKKPQWSEVVKWLKYKY
jgi:ABC-2 type transport system permease protein